MLKKIKVRIISNNVVIQWNASVSYSLDYNIWIPLTYRLYDLKLIWGIKIVSL